MMNAGRRGTIAPIIKHADGSWEWAVPQMALDAYDAVTLPGDVYQGKVDPMSDEGMRRAVELAGLVSGGPVAGAVERVAGRAAAREGADAATTMFAKGPMEYDPPKYPERPFKADYPGEVETDAAGKLLRDVDGRPLGARYIAGRTEALRPDRSIGGRDDLAGVVEGTIGRPYRTVPRSEIDDASGGTFVTAAGQPKGVALADDLHPDDIPRVLAHETGHVIDQFAGTIPVDGLTDELVRNYDRLATGKRWSTKPKTPQDIGYPDVEAPRELMVEAIRAYMADPNYVKSAMPQTAARIREHVNANPRLKDTIQFNQGGAPGAAVGFAASAADQSATKGSSTMTPEQQKALALARARRARADADGSVSAAGASTVNAQPVQQQPSSPSGGMSEMPPGMVYDPATNQVIDTNARAELLRREGGFVQSASDMAGQFVKGTPIVGAYIDEAAGAIGGDMARENARAKLRSYEEANPMTSTALQVAGGINGTIGMLAAAPATASRMLGMGGSSIPTRLAASTASGAGIGAVQGFGAGEEGAGNRIRSAIDAGIVGGGLGFATVPAAAAVGAGVNAVANRFAGRSGVVGRSSQDLVGRTLADEGLSVEEAGRVAREMGPTAMLADATEGLRFRAEQIAQSDNPARSGVIGALKDRSAAAGGRINSAFDASLGQRPNVQETLSNLTKTAKTNADALYGQARRENVPVDVAPVLSAIDDQLLTPAERIAGPSGLPTDEVDTALQWVRTHLTDGSSQRTGIEKLDRLDRRIRLRTDAAFKSGRSDVGHALNEVGKVLRSQMKGSSPVYKQARETFSDDMAVKEAFETGQKLFASKTHPDFLAAEMADMSGADREALKLGVRAAVDETMGRVRNGALKGRQLLDADWNERKILTVLGEEDGRRLIAALQGEQAMAETAGQAIGNSATARRMMDNPFRPEAPRIGEMTQSFYHAGRKVAQKGIDVLTEGRRNRLASELGPALTATGEARERIVEELMRIEGRRGASKALNPKRQRIVDAILRGGVLAYDPSALR